MWWWCHSDAAGCGGIQCPFHDLYSGTFSLFYYSFVIRKWKYHHHFTRLSCCTQLAGYGWWRYWLMHLMCRKGKMQNVYKDFLRQWILCNYTFLIPHVGSRTSWMLGPKSGHCTAHCELWIHLITNNFVCKPLFEFSRQYHSSACLKHSVVMLVTCDLSNSVKIQVSLWTLIIL